MNVPGTATSHFYVAFDGTVEQYVDTEIQSSACLDGNADCLTVETQDKGDGFPLWSSDSDVPAWTDAQVEALARLAVWCHETDGIPLEQLSSSKPGTTGIGWHRLGISGNFPAGLLAGKVAGGEAWSTSTGKACPGDARIRQVVDKIIPRAQELAGGDAGVTTGDLDMAMDEATLRKIIRQELHDELNRKQYQDRDQPGVTKRSVVGALFDIDAQIQAPKGS